MKEQGTKLLLSQPPQVSYLGFIHHPEHAEYGFQVLNEDRSTRFVRLAVAKSYFQNGLLLVQEAPDLCYQKVRDDGESTLPSLHGLIHITESDVSEYRASHPNQKPPRKSSARYSE